MSIFPDRLDDDRVRYGREPASIEEREYLRDMTPGADDWWVPHFQAEAEAMYQRSEAFFGEPVTVDEDGDA